MEQLAARWTHNPKVVVFESYSRNKKKFLFVNFRKLQKDDYDKNYLELLEQLTVVGKYDREKFEKIFNSINSFIYVLENDNKIIVTGTLLLEQKFIHQGKCVGHIEDIVIHKDYINQGYGQDLIKFLINEAKNMNCYKVILDCYPEFENFYNKNNFKKSGIQMRIDF